jgi:uncharacterized membrane protein HdeD (DUF308 family)
LQIGSGVISLILSILLIVIGYPVLSANTIIILLSVVLLVIGVERIASGILLVVLSPSLQQAKSGRRRKVTPFTNIGLGAVAIVYSGFGGIFNKLTEPYQPLTTLMLHDNL